jgi:hypothetical protein
MTRWLVCISAVWASGCSPDPICNPNPMHCPVIIETHAYWTKPPATLSPGEVVVEASLVSTRVVGTHSPSTEYAASIFGEHERACTLIRPVAVHVFHVRKVVQGVFEHADFVITEQPGGCSLDESSIRLGHLTPPVGDKPSYLVIRPTTTPPEVAEDIPYPSYGPGKDKSLPVMTWRVEDEPTLCSSPEMAARCTAPAARP